MKKIGLYFALLMLSIGIIWHARSSGMQGASAQSILSLRQRGATEQSAEAHFETEPANDAQKTALTVAVETFRKNTKCNSVSVAIFDHGEVSFYGNQDALYQIGSMTKAFTGLAIQKLIGEGKLHEESTVSELLPGFCAFYQSKPQEITVSQLLTQRSGYTNRETDYPGAGDGKSLQEWAERISGRELQCLPGSEYAYSNVNYNLLGAIIEKVTGRTYREYMECEILSPLELKNTFVGMPGADQEVVPGSRLGYRQVFRYEIPVSEGRIPAGYFYSNATDLARWMQIWMGEADDVPDVFSEMIGSVRERLCEAGDYDFGWELFENGSIGHSGGTPNYSSRIVFSKEKRIGVCVLTNLNVAASTDGLCNSIYENLLGNSGEMSIPSDVWTIFDLIFSGVSIAGVLILMLAMHMKRKGLIVAGVTTGFLVVAICMVMPAVFGAGLGEILYTWAPVSMAGGLGILAADAALIGIRLCLKENRSEDENRKKTGGRAAAYGNHRVSQMG